MKKKSIIQLIKYHTEKNDVGFQHEAYEIAKEFDEMGDSQLAEYIIAQLSNANTFVPQGMEQQSVFFDRIEVRKNELLLLPDAITHDLLGAVNAVERRLGIHKFMFCGAPGTGKTEAVKQFARLLEREIYMVDFSRIIDSRLGQTQKNLASLFQEINAFMQPERALVFFDEFDTIALDRVNTHDLREMGRVASELLKLMDRMNENVVLVATTNLFSHFDKAILRRFDSVIDFDRYDEKDLMDIAEKILNTYLIKMKLENRDIRLFRKIMKLAHPLPMPGTLKNMIKTALAFSDMQGFDYLRRLYGQVCGYLPDDLQRLKEQGFTVREIEILKKESKSSVARKLKGMKRNEQHSSVKGTI
jgi:hypothetical protein